MFIFCYNILNRFKTFNNREKQLKQLAKQTANRLANLYLQKKKISHQKTIETKNIRDNISNKKGFGKDKDNDNKNKGK